jgi:hypothetical protein
MESQVADLQRVRNPPPQYDEPEGGGGGYAATVTVAAADARVESKAAADFVCDGTEDEEQINAALVACYQLHQASTADHEPGGRVLLSEGSFHIHTLSIGRDSGFGSLSPLSTNVALQGQGIDSTIIYQHGGDIGQAIVSEYAGVHLSDFTVDASYATALDYGVRLMGPRCSVERVRFSYLGADSGQALQVDWMARVAGCQFTDLDGAMGVQVNGEGVIVAHNTFESIGYQAVGAPSATKTMVLGNYIENAQGDGGTTEAIKVNANSVVVGNIVDVMSGTASITAGSGSQVANNVLL